jgi:VanZ family protein
LSWTGTISGLAFYDHALTPDEIRLDYGLWQHHRELIAHKAEPPYGLYLFNEQQGTRVPNRGKMGPDLIIPQNYFILQPGFLVPFWQEYRADFAYAKDLAINIFGLVPLGSCFAALFAWLIGAKRTLLYTTLLGFCVSLTIEILQAYMPTRVSGTTDLITNTSGTALGAWLYLNAHVQGWFRRLGLVRTA